MSDIVTAAGVAAVAAGALTLVAAPQFISPVGFGGSASAISTSTLWELELVLSSLALVAYGSQAPTRGPVYVGGFGLLAFTLIVGIDLDDPDHDG